MATKLSVLFAALTASPSPHEPSYLRISNSPSSYQQQPICPSTTGHLRITSMPQGKASNQPSYSCDQFTRNEASEACPRRYVIRYGGEAETQRGVNNKVNGSEDFTLDDFSSCINLHPATSAYSLGDIVVSTWMKEDFQLIHNWSLVQKQFNNI